MCDSSHILVLFDPDNDRAVLHPVSSPGHPLVGPSYAKAGPRDGVHGWSRLGSRCSLQAACRPRRGPALTRHGIDPEILAPRAGADPWCGVSLDALVGA